MAHNLSRERRMLDIERLEDRFSLDRVPRDVVDAISKANGLAWILDQLMVDAPGPFIDRLLEYKDVHDWLSSTVVKELVLARLGKEGQRW